MYIHICIYAYVCNLLERLTGRVKESNNAHSGEKAENPVAVLITRLYVSALRCWSPGGFRGS